MTDLLARLIEESELVQGAGRLLGRLFSAVQESAVGRLAERFSKAMRESLVMKALLFDDAGWASWTGASRAVRWLGTRVKLRPEGDTDGTLLVKLALWILVFFVPLELYLIQRLPTSTKYLSDALVLGSAFILLFETPRRGWAFRATPLDLPIAFMLLVGLASAVVNGESAKIWIFGMRAYLEYAVLYFVVAAAPLGEGDRKKIVHAILLFGIAMALVGAAQKLFGVATPHAWVQALEASQGITTRVFGTMANPNTYAGYLVMIIALFGAFLTERIRPWLRAMVLAGLAVALFSLVYTYSREALFALVAVGLVIAIAGDARALVVLVVFGLLAVVADPKLLDRVLFGFSNTYTSVSLSYGRLYFWEKSLYVISQHPLVGVGPGLFGGSVAKDFHSPVALHYGLESMSNVDSQWIQATAEMGILGLVAYLWILIAIVKTGLQVRKLDQDPFFRAVGLGTAAAAVGFAVQSVFAGLFEVHQVVLILWLAAGVTAWRYRTLKTRATA